MAWCVLWERRERGGGMGARGWCAQENKLGWRSDGAMVLRMWDGCILQFRDGTACRRERWAVNEWEYLIPALRCTARLLVCYVLSAHSDISAMPRTSQM